MFSIFGRQIPGTRTVSKTVALGLLAAAHLATFGPGALQAQNGDAHGGTKNENDFFEKNVALTVFDSSVTESGLPRIKLLRPKHKDDQLKLAPQVAVQPSGAGSNPASDVNSEQSSADGASTTVQQTAEAPIAGQSSMNDGHTASPTEALMAKYGDPQKDAPVLAQDSAPKPFRAMMEALDSGDDKLAYQYAQQYVRHIHNLDQRTKRAMLIQSMALEKTGLAASPMKGDPEYEALRNTLEEDDDTLGPKAAEMQAESVAPRAEQLDPRARAMIQRVLATEDKQELKLESSSGHQSGDKSGAKPRADETSTVESPLNEQTERARIRQALAGRTPVDPKGQVDIYFFLRTTDQKSIAMGKEIQALAARIPVEQGVRLVGLTLDMEDESSIATYRQRSGAQFPIKNGLTLAKRLKIKTVPATVAVARTTFDAVIEDGFRKSYYLEELIKFMQGRR